jgi:hypothetical protein
MDKQCITCKEIKDITLFGKLANSKSGIDNHCKACKVKETKAYKITHRHVDKEWRAKNPDIAKASRKRYKAKNPDGPRNINLKSRYGITLAEYNKLLSDQNDVCAICKGVNKNGRRLFVDHHHATGKVRALLCVGCNSAIGLLKEDAKLARILADYLEKHAKELPNDPSFS